MSGRPSDSNERRLRGPNGWRPGVAGCPECGGAGRVRRTPLKKDGTPRKLSRWEACPCVPGRYPRGAPATSRPVVLFGAALEAPVEYPPGFVRPRRRAECEGGCRPCPLVGCRSHTYLEVVDRGRRIRINYGDRQPEDVPAGESCVEDFIDAHPNGGTLEEVAAVLGVTRERVRQIETDALNKIMRALTRTDPATGERRLTPEGEALRDAFETRMEQAGGIGILLRRAML